MGLAKAAISYLMEEGKRRPFSGRVLTLGVQIVFVNEAELEALADRHGFALAASPATSREPLKGGGVSCDYLFRRLGFTSVVSTDVSDYEGADLVFDLDAAETPSKHIGLYDLVLDGGTLEHVFHAPNALKNILGFTALNGRIVHMSPSSNHIDHGFYMFSPRFFWDFYSANRLNIVACDLFRYSRAGHNVNQWVFGRYTPGSLYRASFGRLGGGLFGVAVIIEKSRDVVEIAIP